MSADPVRKQLVFPWRKKKKKKGKSKRKEQFHEFGKQ